jgi:hypothetical protein
VGRGLKKFRDQRRQLEGRSAALIDYLHATKTEKPSYRSVLERWPNRLLPFCYREVAEAALAHVVGDQTERAYRPGDALEKRRALMEAWAAYCEPKAGNVVSIARRPH